MMMQLGIQESPHLLLQVLLSLAGLQQLLMLLLAVCLVLVPISLNQLQLAGQALLGLMQPLHCLYLLPLHPTYPMAHSHSMSTLRTGCLLLHAAGACSSSPHAEGKFKH